MKTKKLSSDQFSARRPIFATRHRPRTNFCRPPLATGKPSSPPLENLSVGWYPGRSGPGSACQNLAVGPKCNPRRGPAAKMKSPAWPGSQNEIPDVTRRPKCNPRHGPSAEMQSSSVPTWTAMLSPSFKTVQPGQYYGYKNHLTTC